MRAEEAAKMAGSVRWEMMLSSYLWVRNGSDWNFYLLEAHLCPFAGGTSSSTSLGPPLANEDVEGSCY